FIAGPCPCGTVLRRLGHVKGRLSDRVRIAENSRLESADLSEALYPIPGIIDYRAEIAEECGKERLALRLLMWNTDEEAAALAARRALRNIPALAEALSGDTLSATISFEHHYPLSRGVAKKTILDLRKGGSKQ
ncbi:MAG TPA: phenylacetate--CoA ligase family protein, partial [Geobacteraceae bacterium]